MKYLISYKVYDSAITTHSIRSRNRLKVIEYGSEFKLEYKSKNGKGHGLIFNNKSKRFDIIDELEMKDDEMFLFAIETTPSNSGVGREFIKDIFDYFNINKIYLPSDDDHAVWNKIATKTDKKSYNTTIFYITREQLFQ